MPNWCQNSVTLEHTDPAAITRALEAFENQRFLNEFVPCPEILHSQDSPNTDSNAAELIQQYGAADWYSWCIQNWGTKWDVGGSSDLAEKISNHEIQLSFDSAWSPPIEAYRAMEALGFKIEAHYYEPGVCFFGTYQAGVEDTVDFSSMTADTIRSDFADADQRWCISDWLEECQELIDSSDH